MPKRELIRRIDQEAASGGRGSPSGSGTNADTVDGIHASRVPTHDTLFPLDPTGAIPASVQQKIDHGNLAGLSDDDHAQYLLASGMRTGSTIQAQSFGAHGIEADQIVEATTDAGVLVEDVLLKDSGASLGGGIKLPLVTKTAGYTATAQDHTILVDASGGAVTITLPAAANAWDNIRNAGSVLTIKKIDSTANVVTIDGSGSETIDGSLTQTLSTQWDKLSVQSNGTAWFII